MPFLKDFFQSRSHLYILEIRTWVHLLRHILHLSAHFISTFQFFNRHPLGIGSVLTALLKIIISLTHSPYLLNFPHNVLHHLTWYIVYWLVIYYEWKSASPVRTTRPFCLSILHNVRCRSIVQWVVNVVIFTDDYTGLERSSHFIKCDIQSKVSPTQSHCSNMVAYPTAWWTRISRLGSLGTSINLCLKEHGIDFWPLHGLLSSKSFPLFSALAGPIPHGKSFPCNVFTSHALTDALSWVTEEEIHSLQTSFIWRLLASQPIGIVGTDNL